MTNLCACGSSDIFAIKPGVAALYAPGDILIEREVPTVFTCRACLLKSKPKELKIMTMTGKIALDAHNLLSAVEKAMKGRGDKAASAAQFLTELHSCGFDVVTAATVATAPVALAAE